MALLFVGVVAHKNFYMTQTDGYFPIFVGKNSENLKKSYIGNLSYTDDGGENISYKNPFYSELTAQYWIYKNIKNVDFKGLVHYRRFFSGKGQNLITKKEISEILSFNDVILPNKVFSKYNVYNTYKLHHNIKDLDGIRKVLNDKYPEYLPNFDKVMKRHGYHSLNMLIAKKDVFDKYSGWLFDVLFASESIIKSADDSYQQRVYGFLSERLLDVWVETNNLSVYELDVTNTEQSLTSKYYELSKRNVYQLLFKQ